MANHSIDYKSRSTERPRAASEKKSEDQAYRQAVIGYEDYGYGLSYTDHGISGYASSRPVPTKMKCNLKLYMKKLIVINL